MMNQFNIIREIKHTDLSTLFEAYSTDQAGNPDGLKYLLKRYHGSVLSDLIENEISISQYIERTSTTSLVIPIFKKDIFDENECIVMQYRENGLFLSEIIDYLEEKYGEKRIPFYIVIDITIAILESLGRLHTYKDGGTSGFLHLDLNPGNIFFESADPSKEEWGNVKFIDFSSAVDIKKKDRELQKRGWFCITEGYSSPEVVENDWSHISYSSDIYSICCCMIRMVYGRDFQKSQTGYIYSDSENRSDLITQLFHEIIMNSTVSPSYYRYRDARSMQNDLITLKKCIEDIDIGNYYELFKNCYEMGIEKDQVVASIKHISKTGLEKAILFLEGSLRKDNVIYLRNRYIYEGLHDLATRDVKVKDSIYVSLLNSGLTCYNYTGDTTRAIQLFENLIKVDRLMSINDYITLQLRYASSLLDCYRYEKAEKIVGQLIQGIESFKMISDGMEQSRIVEFGRAYSSYATILSLLGRSKVLEYYQKALHEFQGDVGNSAITYFKVIHYAIDIKDRELFNHYQNLYFGNKESLFEKLEMAKNNSYQLFLLLKGIYCFDIDHATLEFLKELSDYLDQVEIHNDEHPYELIYKYAALISMKKGMQDKAYDYYEKAITCIPAGDTVYTEQLNIYQLINYQTTWIWNDINGRSSKNGILIEEILERVCDSEWKELEMEILARNSMESILRCEFC